MRQANQRVIGHDEAFVPCERDGAVELGRAHVPDRFGEQKGSAWPEQLMNLVQEVGLVADFVHHREGESEIEGSSVFGQTDGIAGR
jgi:hypothetical protein